MFFLRSKRMSGIIVIIFILGKCEIISAVNLEQKNKSENINNVSAINLHKYKIYNLLTDR